MLIALLSVAGGCGDNDRPRSQPTASPTLAVTATVTIPPTATTGPMPSATPTATPLEAVLDPNVAGPYAVGTTAEPFVRTLANGDPRELRTIVWYPVPPEAATGELFQDGFRDAPIADGRFPLLVFSHGSCGLPGQSKFLMTRLASYGFIVAAPPHPGNTIFDDPSPERCTDPRFLGDSFLKRAADIIFVIDRMLDLPPVDPRFAGAIDADRIGVFGHSFGGQTALRVAAMDQRIVAVLSLAPGSSGLIAPQIEAIAVPAMVQGGEKDTIAPFDDNDRFAYDLLAAPRFLVEILNTGHFAFADNCLAPSGSTYPDCAPGTLTQEEAHVPVLRFAVPFFGRYVAENHGWDAWLDPTGSPSSVHYTVDP